MRVVLCFALASSPLLSSPLLSPLPRPVLQAQQAQPALAVCATFAFALSHTPPCRRRPVHMSCIRRAAKEAASSPSMTGEPSSLWSRHERLFDSHTALEGVLGAKSGSTRPCNHCGPLSRRERGEGPGASLLIDRDGEIVPCPRSYPGPHPSLRTSLQPVCFFLSSLHIIPKF